MKPHLKIAILIPLLLGSISAFAAGSTQNISNASTHSAHALAQTSVSGVKIVSGVIATPLIVAGELGNISAHIGHTLWDLATVPLNEPLKITDDIITSTPSPAQAMNNDLL